MAEWGKPSARSTMHQDMAILRQTLKTAVRHGWLDRLPDMSEPYRASPKISHRAWFSPEEYKQTIAPPSIRKKPDAPVTRLPRRRQSCWSQRPIEQTWQQSPRQSRERRWYKHGRTARISCSGPALDRIDKEALNSQPEKLKELCCLSGSFASESALAAEKNLAGYSFVEFDQALYTAITKLHEALGDSSDSPRFIETVPRPGYRFS